MRNKPKADRAKLFLPFDSLKGFQDALREKERVIVPKKTLSSDEEERLSHEILKINNSDMVKLIYYDTDHYLEIEGIVTKIDFTFRTITVVKQTIPFSDIIEIKISEAYND